MATLALTTNRKDTTVGKKEYTIPELIEFVNRELDYKKLKQPGLVDAGKMKQSTSDMIIGKFEAVVEALERLDDIEG